MPSTDDRGVIAKAVKLMLQQAYTTEMYLVLEVE
jgi:hypothetical protein